MEAPPRISILALSRLNFDKFYLEGACGAQCACSTCHVILEEAVYNQLPPPSEAEVCSDGVGMAWSVAESDGSQMAWFCTSFSDKSEFSARVDLDMGQGCVHGSIATVGGGIRNLGGWGLRKAYLSIVFGWRGGGARKGRNPSPLTHPWYGHILVRTPAGV